MTSIYNPPPSRAAQSRAAAWAAMNPDLREQAQAIEDAVRTGANRDALFHYLLGERLLSIHADPSTFGANAIDLLMAALSRYRQPLRKAIALVEWIPCPQDFVTLLNRQGSRLVRLSWGHICALLRLRDLAVRQEHLEMVFRQGLSAKRLQNMITAQGPHRQQRPDLLPRTLIGGLTRQAVRASRWTQQLQDLAAWFESQLSEVQDSAVNAELVEKVTNAYQDLESLSHAAGEQARRMAQQCRRLNRLLENRRRQPEPAPTAISSGNDPAQNLNRLRGLFRSLRR